MAPSNKQQTLAGFFGLPNVPKVVDEASPGKSSDENEIQTQTKSPMKSDAASPMAKKQRVDDATAVANAVADDAVRAKAGDGGAVEATKEAEARAAREDDGEDDDADSPDVTGWLKRDRSLSGGARRWRPRRASECCRRRTPAPPLCLPVGLPGA